MRKPIQFFAILAVLWLPHALTFADDSGQPNVILIMADDVSWEAFGCYGAEDYETPQLDRLAKNGLRFAHCYSTPICTTSRVKIMTGKYNFRNYTHFGYLNPDEKTFGHLFQQAGYKTAIAGKWQLNGLYNSLPSSDQPSRPQKAGFDESMLWQVTTGKGGQGGERFRSPPIEHNGKFLTKEMNAGRYGPDMFCDFVCDFVDRNKSQPFFVYYPMVLVHDPFVPTPDSVGSRAKNASLNKAPKNKAKRKENFVAMVNYMDKIVGRIVDQVEQAGLSENTIILFTADNGTNKSITSKWNGQQIRGGKGEMKDMGTHVPLIAFWKGHTPQGVVLNDAIDGTDFYATFVDVSKSKLEKKDPRDGVSFFPQLNGDTGPPRQWVLCHYEPYWNKKSGQFARTADYKLYRDGGFFNVPRDLAEQNSLSQPSDDSARQIHALLSATLDLCPPAPAGANANKNTKDRPTYPDWRFLDSTKEDESIK